MKVAYGLTTWNLSVGRIALMWRWNMRLGEAVHTCNWRRLGHSHGYAAVGPLIVEW
jgi:hypothetical protein